MIDVFQLDYQQRIFLCNQIVKQDDLRQELDLLNQDDINCIPGQIKCPRIVIREEKSQQSHFLDCDFYLQNSSQPNTVIINQEYWLYINNRRRCFKSQKALGHCGLLLGIRKDFLENLKITSNWKQAAAMWMLQKQIRRWRCCMRWECFI